MWNGPPPKREVGETKTKLYVSLKCNLALMLLLMRHPSQDAPHHPLKHEVDETKTQLKLNFNATQS